MNETTPSQPPAFLIEVDVNKRIGKPESTTRGAGDKLRELSEAQMQNAFALVEKVAARAAESLQTLQADDSRPKPAAMEVEFGLSFTADVQAYVVKAASEATLSVKLAWTGS